MFRQSSPEQGTQAPQKTKEKKGISGKILGIATGAGLMISALLNPSGAEAANVSDISPDFLAGKIQVLPIGNGFELFVPGQNEVLTVTESGLKKIQAGLALEESDVLYYNPNSFDPIRALKQGADGCDIKYAGDLSTSAMATGLNCATSMVGAAMSEGSMGNVVRSINEFNPINIATKAFLGLFEPKTFSDLQAKMEDAKTTEEINEILSKLPPAIQEAYKQHGKIIFELADATNEGDLDKVVQTSRDLLKKAGAESRTAQRLLNAVDATLIKNGVGSLAVSVKKVGNEFQWSISAKAAQQDENGNIYSTQVGFTTLNTNNEGQNQRFYGAELGSGVENGGLRVGQNLRGGFLEGGKTTTDGNIRTERGSAMMGEATVGVDYTFQHGFAKGFNLGAEAGANLITPENNPSSVTGVFGGRIGYSTSFDNAFVKGGNIGASAFSGPEGMTPALNVGANFDIGAPNDLRVGAGISPNATLNGVSINPLHALDIGYDGKEWMKEKAVTTEILRLAELIGSGEIDGNFEKLKTYIVPTDTKISLERFLEQYGENEKQIPNNIKTFLKTLLEKFERGENPDNVQPSVKVLLEQYEEGQISNDVKTALEQFLEQYESGEKKKEKIPDAVKTALKDLLEKQAKGENIDTALQALKQSSIEASSQTLGSTLKYEGPALAQKHNPRSIGDIDTRAFKVSKELAERGVKKIVLSNTVAETPTNLSLPATADFSITKNTTTNKVFVISGTTGLTTAQVLARLTLTKTVDNTAITNDPTDKLTGGPAGGAWNIVDNGNGTMNLTIAFTAANVGTSPQDTFRLDGDNAVNADVTDTFVTTAAPF